MPASLNLIKLCVGVDSIAELDAWRQERKMEQAVLGQPWRSIHVTRMWPKRAAELLAGGSLYWVIRGIVQCRQQIIGLEPVTFGDGVTRCAIVMDPTLMRTRAQPRRPFQGWRYLPGADAPPDTGPYQPGEPDLPPGLLAGLAGLGVV
jgi:hypothetical protein